MESAESAEEMASMVKALLAARYVKGKLMVGKGKGPNVFLRVCAVSVAWPRLMLCAVHTHTHLQCTLSFSPTQLKLGLQLEDSLSLWTRMKLKQASRLTKDTNRKRESKKKDFSRAECHF